jgi:Holliday junction resolvase RusA-like endonuclease
MIVSKEAKDFKKKVIAMTKGTEMVEGNVKVSLDVYRPKRIGDLDNQIKVTLDALKGIAFGDDKQVIELHAYRYDDKGNPRVEVTVEVA